MEIAVIGSNMVDLITYVNRMPKLGETLEAPSFEIGCGGKGANQAVAAAKLGASVIMVTKVGDDLFAENTIRNFQKYGIDTQYVTRVDICLIPPPPFSQYPSTSTILPPILVNHLG